MYLVWCFSRLGTSSEGAHLRARMQSACLLSDMEAFKAANPACTLGDFVRWYSPRDWVEEETVDDTGKVTIKGQLLYPVVQCVTIIITETVVVQNI